MRKPKDYWKDFRNVRREVLAFVDDQGEPGKMPTITELRGAGHGSLVIAIHKYHGDFPKVARRLRLAMTHKPKGYWKDFRNLKREILAFVSESAEPGRMPTMRELKHAGHASLVSAIHQYHGSLFEVAQRLDLSVPQRPIGYWKDFGNVRQELLAFVAEHGIAGKMPTGSELRRAGQNSLASAIHKYHGDFREVAHRLGLSITRTYEGRGRRFDRPESGSSGWLDPSERGQFRPTP
ncbi:MAG: hypothetical protein A2V70_06825 [Planctomycetes bacterium RBG_13_63_9]|nr:MAG: hypothetical protein A2V70_06825 [Planctomycetes bacterium RBG_13_63_9]